ncbi:glycoside hydrolase family 104 protein [Iningainema tapete]|uniref:Glycoside hydrolase family 104 protein n=1 Tax=Iningainema tapete BLCC-T55 TaxID=2748662 RepID=A0A8J7CC43_9CYAN|nr:glycoside hydrolase family 104 protein [Iningainema tapete]MBD2772125.1 glycoside hydrolase family 104 protein [Iningainema tapete BLCC-T55]
MRIIPIFISGLVGAASCVAFSYGATSLPCRLVSKGADTVCLLNSFGKALDSWKFGFIAGGLVGLVWNPRYNLLSRFQPIHLSVASLVVLGIYLFKIPNNVGIASISSSRFSSSDFNSYSKQMQAFLATIRWAETGTSGSESYRKLVFNGEFNDFSSHPLRKQCAPINGRTVCSTAAGGYQMLDKNWYYLKDRLQLKDFSPASQDKMAVALITEAGALNDVNAGNFNSAVRKVGRIWASMPYNNYGQNPKSLEQLISYYQQQLVSSR